jgi:tetratricopeptide (TPR) repeat protein
MTQPPEELGMKEACLDTNLVSHEPGTETWETLYDRGVDAAGEATEAGFDEAVECLRAALKVLEEQSDVRPEAILTVLQMLASVLWFKDDYAAADPAFCRAIALQKELFGEHSESAVETLENFAGMLLDDQRCEEGEAVLNQIIAISESQIQSWQLKLGEALEGKSICKSRLGNDEIALRLQERAVAAIEQSQGAEASALIAPLQRYARLLCESGKIVDGDRMAARAEKLLVRFNEKRHGVEE